MVQGSKPWIRTSKLAHKEREEREKREERRGASGAWRARALTVGCYLGPHENTLLDCLADHFLQTQRRKWQSGGRERERGGRGREREREGDLVLGFKGIKILGPTV
jgi:hypothetical protein